MALQARGSQSAIELDNLEPSSETQASPFLRELTLEHGPTDILGRFFLRADHEARSRGVTLAFANFDELLRVNKANRDSWGTLMPMFDPEQSDFEGDTCLCLLGYDRQGDVVATQAARFYDLTGSSLKQEAESLRLFFGTREPNADAICTVTSEACGKICTSATYSGSTWFRPDYRKCGLSALLPRISRTYALTKWNSQFTVSFVDWVLVEKGVTARYGYNEVADGIEMIGIVETDFGGGVAWMTQVELLKDLKEFSSSNGPQLKAGLG